MSETTVLCDLWQSLCEDDSAIVLARPNAAELSEHIEDCPKCSEVRPLNNEQLARIYDAFAGEVSTVSDDEQDELVRLRADVENQVRTAVTDVLYSQLGSLADSVKHLDALVVYRAIDALAMFAERQTRGRHPSATLSATEGLLVYGEQEHIGPSVLVREVRLMSKVEDDVAARQLFGWSLQAACRIPTLFPGARATPLGADRIQLDIGARPLDLDLAVQWAPESIKGRRRLMSHRAPLGGAT